MLLFFVVAVSSAIGIRIGIVEKNKKLLRVSFVILFVDIALFIIGSILYAIYA